MARLLEIQYGRREIFRTARTVLVITPAVIHLWWSCGSIAHARREGRSEAPPWEEQAEIDRREFLRKACDVRRGGSHAEALWADSMLDVKWGKEPPCQP
jgi:hypothetical protein